MFSLETINLLVSAGSIVMLVATLALAVDIIFADGKHLETSVSPVALPLIIIITIGGSLITFVYSEIFGIIPCALCWLQRVALYPQAFISIGGKIWRDTVMMPRYGIMLSLAGLLVAVYQYIYQILPKGSLPCPATGGTVDCFEKVINEFGFITYPFISASTFAFLIILYIIIGRTKRQ